MKIERLILVFAVLLLFLTGCGLFKTMKAGGLPQSPPGVGKGDFSHTMAARFGVMALFSEAVYGRPIDQSGKPTIQDCEELDAHQKQYLMPRYYSSDNSEYGWERLSADGISNPVGCLSKSGLFMETYVFRDSDGKLTEAVIAYRGTEASLVAPVRMFQDLIASFSTIFGFEPKQYKIARIETLETIKHLDSLSDSVKDIKISAVGHSLGGGLAQQAGYLSQRIGEVFTFNTSPVTNWSSIKLQGEIENDYPVIYRIYNGGEFLEFARFFTTTFTSTRYNRFDVGIQVSERSGFGGHGIRLIACELARVFSAVSIDTISEARSLSKNYVDNQLLANGKLCAVRV